MNKIKDNIIFKTIVSLLTVAVMTVIIVFVFNYYTEIAKEKKSNINNGEETNNGETNNETNESSVDFVEYDKSKTRIFIDKKAFYLSVAVTDAGKVVALDDYPLMDYKSNMDLKYAVLDDIFVIVSSDSDLINKVVIVNKELDSATFEGLETKDYNYKITVTTKDNKIYINYKINIDLDDYESYNLKNTSLIEYTYEISNQDDNLVKEQIKKVTLEDYLKK